MELLRGPVSVPKEHSSTTVRPLGDSITQTEHVYLQTEETSFVKATTITGSNSDPTTTTEHETTQSFTNDFTSSSNSETSHQTSTSSTKKKESPGTTISPLGGSITLTKLPYQQSQGQTDIRRIITNLQVCLHSKTGEAVRLESLQNLAAEMQKKLRKELCKDCTLKILQIQPKRTDL
ncbi:uncharacterized protein Hap1MRO34_000111 [Clarias gariepinus]